MDQVERLSCLGRGIEQLLPDPGHRRMGGHVEMDQLATLVLDKEQHVERLEGQGLDDKQIRPRS